MGGDAAPRAPTEGSSVSIRPIAVTMGEPAGVGAEIACKAWRRLSRRVRPFSCSTIRAARPGGPGLPARPVASPAEPPPASARRCRCCLWRRRWWCGRDGPTGQQRRRDREHPSRGRSGARRRGLGLVTNPIQKGSLYAAGFAHPGHTEFLAALTGAPLPVMMIASPDLRVVPVTIHIPLAAVPAALTPDLIVETVRIVAEGLRTDFGIAAPRIAVAGLNPHAGEDGSIGTEDRDIVAPASIGCARWASMSRARCRPTRCSTPGPGPLRCGGVHVPRPGPDPGQDARFRPRRQRHARTADRAHLARSWHRARHRGTRHCPARQLDRRDRTRGPDGLEQGGRARP